MYVVGLQAPTMHPCSYNYVQGLQAPSIFLNMRRHTYVYQCGLQAPHNIGICVCVYACNMHQLSLIHI